MLDSLSNIFKITELRNKILYTLMMFAVFRAGIHIPVPGVDASVIESLFTSGNLFGLLDLFAGGALSKFSIFAMSITPYINASIIMQLLQSVVPQFEAWSKDGEDGRKKIAKVTRYGTVVLGFVQAAGIDVYKRQGDAKVLFITEGDVNVERSARNIQGVKALACEGMNIFDLLHYDKLFITKGAVAKIEEVLG